MDNATLFFTIFFGLAVAALVFAPLNRYYRRHSQK
jgi:hypothetical protein